MPKVTIKELQKALNNANKTINLQMDEIARLNRELETTKHGQNVVSIEEFNGILLELGRVKEFSKIMENQKNREIDSLKKQVEYLKSKIEENEHNERGAGRKKFEDYEVIHTIFGFYGMGDSLQKIADRLNEAGIKTKAGGAWAKSSVRFILTNRKYVEDGIISEAVFNDVAELLKNRRKI